jgi:hypothetical protein
VGLVDDAGALGLWQDEVEVEQEAEVGVEGDPGTESQYKGLFVKWQGERRGDKEGLNGLPDEEPVRPGLNYQEAGEDHPVHQPWRQLGRVRGLQGLVGGEEGKEEGGYGAVWTIG